MTSPGTPDDKPVALVLVSGGLDSTLAVRLLQEQGVTVKALTFVSVFSPGRSEKGGSAARKTMSALGVDLIVRNAAPAMMKFVPEPRFGWGRHLNPCMDCRSHYLSVAKTMFEELGVSYVVTGEVLGQRPMSQHRQAMQRIEKHVGLEGLILRPLTAQNLDPTIPEERGWVDRTRLLGIQGRSRAEQNKLVAQWGLSGFNTPAGGCLLTDAQFAFKLEDLLNYEGLTPNDAHLLKYGRHFRLDARTRAIVGRDERENARLVTFRRQGDWILVAAAGSSPEVLLRGDSSKRNLEIAGRLAARYSGHRREPEVEILACAADSTLTNADGAAPSVVEKRFTVAPADDTMIDELAVRRT